MTDSNDDNRRGRPPGRSDRGRTSSGDRPFRKPRESGERPFRARGDDDRPRKPRDAGDKPFRPRGEGGNRPFRSRDNDERPRRFEGGDKPFRARSAGDKPFRPRGEGGDKPFRARREEGDRPVRGRGGDDRPRRFDRSAEDRPRRTAREERPPVRVDPQEPVEDRIAKVIARAGVASRRDAEVLIAEGRVTLNGKVLESPAVNVTAADMIAVDGEPLPAKERTRLWLFHKPRGLVTTAKDPEGRPTVFDNLPEDLPRVVAVGRLEINTEGLLLLTNDGGLARVIAHPDTGWLRRYKVRAHGEINQADLDRLRDGISIDGIDYGPIEARLDRVQGDNAWITMGLREGKNREIKRILEHMGVQVNRLIRMSFGPFQLGDLEVGLVEEVRTRVLKDQLGEALAIEAGVDFESPVREPIAPFGSSKERQERDERPGRSARGRDEERPRRRRDDDERPFRSRDGERRDRDQEEPRKFPSRLDVKKTVWRAGETDEDAPRKKMPRRGADPREARAVSGERQRERMGAITSKEGRKVRVERLVRQPQEEEAPAARGGRGAAGFDDRPRRRDDRDAAPARREREGAARPPRNDDERPRRPAGDRPFRARTESGEDRPRRPQGDRPFRSREGGDDRPRKPQSERPFRARGDDERPRRSDGDRPFRARGDDDRPRRGPPRGDGPSRSGPRGGAGGGFKSGPRGGASKGGFKGGSKGGPRGRR